MDLKFLIKYANFFLINFYNAEINSKKSNYSVSAMKVRKIAKIEFLF